MTGRNSFVIAMLAFALQGTLMGQTELANINSSYDEFHLRVSPENTLFFTRAFHPKNVAKKADPGDIWMAKPGENESWESPVHVAELSTDGFDVILGFEGSGDAMVYHDDRKQLQGIFRYRFNDGEWKRVGQEEIPGFQNFGTSFSGYLHPDGGVIVVSMQSYGALGNEDIYFIEKQENMKWGRPVNVGADVNSSFQELTPFLSKDKQTLFFSSNGHGREGGTGVFVTRRTRDNNFTSWSQPRPVPSLPTNGKVTHYSLGLNENGAFFTSTVSSEHYGNLYSVEGYEPDMVTDMEEVEDETPIENIVEVLRLSSEEPLPPAGVIDSEDGERIPERVETPPVEERGPTAVDYLQSLKEKYPDAEFKILDRFGEKIDNLERYWGPLGDLNAFVLTEGYMPYAIDWEGRPEDLEFVPAKAGNKLVLRQVNFKKGTAEFSDRLADSFLEMIAQFLTQNPQQLIQVEGHTDNFGSAQLNKDLSLRRAAKVRDILVEKGIPFDKIRVTGHGGTRPMTSNQTEEGRELNRRVELLIVE